MSIENFSLKIFEYKNETCIRAEIITVLAIIRMDFLISHLLNDNY